MVFIYCSSTGFRGRPVRGISMLRYELTGVRRPSMLTREFRSPVTAKGFALRVRISMLRNRVKARPEGRETQ